MSEEIVEITLSFISTHHNTHACCEQGMRKNGRKIRDFALLPARAAIESQTTDGIGFNEPSNILRLIKNSHIL